MSSEGSDWSDFEKTPIKKPQKRPATKTKPKRSQGQTSDNFFDISTPSKEKVEDIDDFSDCSSVHAVDIKPLKIPKLRQFMPDEKPVAPKSEPVVECLSDDSLDNILKEDDSASANLLGSNLPVSNNTYFPGRGGVSMETYAYNDYSGSYNLDLPGSLPTSVTVTLKYGDKSEEVVLKMTSTVSPLFSKARRLCKQRFYIRFDQKIIQQDLHVSKSGLMDNDVLVLKPLEEDYSANSDLASVFLLFQFKVHDVDRLTHKVSLEKTDSIGFLMDMIVLQFPELEVSKNNLVCLYKGTRLYRSVNIGPLLGLDNAVTLEIHDQELFKAQEAQKTKALEDEEDSEDAIVEAPPEPSSYVLKLALKEKQHVAIRVPKNIQLETLLAMAAEKLGGKCRLSFDGEKLTQDMLDDDIEPGDVLQAKLL